MAKFSSYHTLCPGIDPQNLLGAEKDADSGCSVVTLGRHMVYRYKLQDLKEVSCWSTQEWLTTQVVYDGKTDRYVAVFNEKYVRTWGKNEKHLHKVKKYKFDMVFRGIVSSPNGTPVLIRRDGATASLEWSLANRKNWTSKGILNNPNEELSDYRLISIADKTYFCALSGIKAPQNFNHLLENCTYIVVEVNDNDYTENANNINRIELKRPSEMLMGHVILQDQNNAYLLTLWSHGRLYSYPLIGPCAEPIPGILVSVMTSISTKNPVAMTALNEATIAIYGADANEEGAVLLIYNIQFKLVQAIHKLKLYTKGAKLWQMDNKLLLAANQHLAVVPYRLASQRIETMLGSSLRFQKQSNNDDCEVMEIRESTIANWQNNDIIPKNISMQHLSKIIAKQITAYVNEGASDATILQGIIPQLIDSKDIKTILWCLDNFSDLPEKLLIDLLSFGLRTSDTTYLPVQNGTTDDEHSPELINRHKFLDKLFSLSFMDICLLPHLKSVLTFDEALVLMKYSIEKLESEEEKYQVQANEKQLYEWCSLLLDSHYQHYLLSQDPEVLALLHKLNDVLENHFQALKEIEDLRPMIERIINGKPLKISSKGINKFYSIELFQLYE